MTKTKRRNVKNMHLEDSSLSSTMFFDFLKKAIFTESVALIYF